MNKFKLILINTLILILFGVVTMSFHNNNLDLYAIITMQLMLLYSAIISCINLYKQKGKVAYLVFLSIITFQIFIFYKLQYKNIWRY
ncbi:hypothetical protein WG909_09010 [Peptostreptococcaceae bacterium AGR-M142]